MKVLFLTHEYSRSGGPIQLFRTIRETLRQRPGWDVSVLGLSDGPLRAEYEAELGLPAALVEIDRGQPFHYDELLAEIDRREPDLVVLNGVTFYQEAPMLKWLGRRVVWIIHDGIDVARRDGELFRSPELQGMITWSLGFQDRAVFAARFTHEQYGSLHRAMAERGETIPYGLDLEALDAELEGLRPRRAELRRELGLADGDLAFLCVGAVQPRKNQRALARAFQTLLDRAGKDEAKRLKLIFLGGINETEPEALRYKESIERELRPEHAANVAFLGLRPSPLPAFVACDAHVLISINECSPLSNHEALAAGLPCLSSRVHGIPELLEHDRTGFLVDPTDDAEVDAALARLHAMLRSRDGLLDAVRVAGRERIEERHDIRGATARFCALCDEVAAERKDRRDTLPRAAWYHRYLQQQITARWCMFKGEPELESLVVGHLPIEISPPPPGLRAAAKRALRSVLAKLRA